MDKIIEAVKKLVTPEKTIVIGIDGLGGSGKSTISEVIKDTLIEDGINTVLLHIDDFIHPRTVRYNENYEEWECYKYLQWRYDYLIREIIKPVKKGKEFSGEVEIYDKENDSYIMQRLEIPLGTVIIIEGVFLQRKELSGIFDYMVYIDVSENERLKRVLKRDGYIGDEEQIRKKYENRYFPAERKYFNSYSPRDNADIVIK